MDRGGSDGDITDVFKTTKGTDTGTRADSPNPRIAELQQLQARLQTSLSASGFPLFNPFSSESAAKVIF